MRITRFKQARKCASLSYRQQYLPSVVGTNLSSAPTATEAKNERRKRNMDCVMPIASAPFASHGCSLNTFSYITVDTTYPNGYCKLSLIMTELLRKLSAYSLVILSNFDRSNTACPPQSTLATLGEENDVITCVINNSDVSLAHYTCSLQ